MALRKGTIGATLRMRVLLDDGSIFDGRTATVMALYLRKPSGAVVQRNLAYETDGSDGRFKYVTIAGDLDAAGPWTGQAEFTLPTGTFPTAPWNFTIEDNLF